MMNVDSSATHGRPCGVSGRSTAEREGCKSEMEGSMTSGVVGQDKLLLRPRVGPLTRGRRKR